jgi:hypothetical protein
LRTLIAWITNFMMGRAQTLAIMACLGATLPLLATLVVHADAVFDVEGVNFEALVPLFGPLPFFGAVNLTGQ